MRANVCLARFVVASSVFLVCAASSLGSAAGGEVRQATDNERPSNGERTLHVTEAWRVETADEGELIGYIRAALAGPDGTVWLADNQLGQVLVYSAEGSHLRTISRQGEGPGEIDGPRQLLWLPGGGLGIVDRRPGQITLIDAEGLPLSSIRLVAADSEPLSTVFISQVRCGGETLAVAGYQILFSSGFPTQSRFLGIFDTAGRERLRLRESPSGFDVQARSFDEQKHWFPERDLFAVDSAGRLYVAATRDRYRIDVHDAGGTLVQVIERSYEPRRRTSAEKERLFGGVSISIDGQIVRPRSTFDDFAPAIERFWLGADGCLWVLPGHGRRGEVGHRSEAYDVFDASGRFRETVLLDIAFDEDRDRLWPLADERWLLLKNLHGSRDDVDDGDDAQLVIVCLEAAAASE